MGGLYRNQLLLDAPGLKAQTHPQTEFTSCCCFWVKTLQLIFWRLLLLLFLCYMKNRIGWESLMALWVFEIPLKPIIKNSKCGFQSEIRRNSRISSLFPKIPKKLSFWRCKALVWQQQFIILNISMSSVKIYLLLMNRKSPRTRRKLSWDSSLWFHEVTITPKLVIIITVIRPTIKNLPAVW